VLLGYSPNLQKLHTNRLYVLDAACAFMQAGSSVVVACTLLAAMQTKQGGQHSEQTAHSSLQQQSPLTYKAVSSRSHL
jgi:predicted ArsR family transcriptional regulator